MYKYTYTYVPMHYVTDVPQHRNYDGMSQIADCVSNKDAVDR
jgi:hypothetical protein